MVLGGATQRSVDERKRILVVDDEPTIRELIADALSEFGYLVEVASNGAEGLAIMQRWRPDAIVLDLMMPRVNGLNFVEMFRANPEFEAIPVLLVTAAYAAHDVASRIAARAYLAKPFELDRLVELVGELTTSPEDVPGVEQPSPAEA
jgi:two-component system response regulator MprA